MVTLFTVNSALVMEVWHGTTDLYLKDITGLIKAIVGIFFSFKVFHTNNTCHTPCLHKYTDTLLFTRNAVPNSTSHVTAAEETCILPPKNRVRDGGKFAQGLLNTHSLKTQGESTRH